MLVYAAQHVDVAGADGDRDGPAHVPVQVGVASLRQEIEQAPRLRPPATADVLDAAVQGLEGLARLARGEDGRQRGVQVVPYLLVELLELGGARRGAQVLDDELLGALGAVEGRIGGLGQVDQVDGLGPFALHLAHPSRFRLTRGNWAALHTLGILCGGPALGGWSLLLGRRGCEGAGRSVL